MESFCKLCFYNSNGMGMWIGTFVSSASDVFVVVVNPLYCRQINTENMVKWCISTGAVTEQLHR